MSQAGLGEDRLLAALERAAPSRILDSWWDSRAPYGVHWRSGCGILCSEPSGRWSARCCWVRA